MIRRAFIKRFSAGVLGCGMLAEALLSRGPSMEVVEMDEQRPVATVRARGYDVLDLGPRVRDRPDMEHRFEASADNPYRHYNVRRGVIYLNGKRDRG